MKKVKIFSWVVCLDAEDAGFLAVPCRTGYLERLELGEQGRVKPIYGDKPILYPFRSACFLVRELRRSGYNVSGVPYAWLMLKAGLRAWKARKAAKAAARAKWRK